METAVASGKLIDSITETKPRPRPIDVVEATEVTQVETPKLTDKEKLELIVRSLEDVRLSMKDSEGQGFLFNATATIRLYLQR